MIVCRCKWNW